MPTPRLDSNVSLIVYWGAFHGSLCRGHCHESARQRETSMRKLQSGSPKGPRFRDLYES